MAVKVFDEDNKFTEVYLSAKNRKPVSTLNDYITILLQNIKKEINSDYTAAFLAIISPELDFNQKETTHIFLFCNLEIIDFNGSFSGIHGCFGQVEVKTLGAIHDIRDKTKINSSGTVLGPLASAPSFALRSSPRGQPGAREISIYFFVG